jgi:hypothetical protein
MRYGYLMEEVYGFLFYFKQIGLVSHSTSTTDIPIVVCLINVQMFSQILVVLIGGLPTDSLVLVVICIAFTCCSRITHFACQVQDLTKNEYLN